MKGFVLLGFASYALAALPSAEKVMGLPGWGDMSLLNFEVYSGYIDLTSTKSLHYVLVTSQNKPADDPLQIWLNGGPGCSSLLGFMAENGPFVVEDGQDMLHFNQWSWNQKSNILYLEMPGGVGFSTCDGPSGECHFDDEKATNDNVPALIKWFDKYKDFQKNDFYITGESYAGVYIPYTVKKILEHNDSVAV